MPIRINLLAEAQLAEELRRKDPVKRTIMLGGAFAVIMACVSLVIQSQVMATNRYADGLTQKLQAYTNEFSVVMEDKKRLELFRLNRRGLDILASERFLYGTFLNALQGATVDGVQMVHIRTDHAYSTIDESRSKPAGTSLGSTKVLKPASASEKLVIILEARDISSNPGEQVTAFKERLSKTDFFKTLVGTNDQMRLVNRSVPTVQPDTGRLGVQFTLEARVPEKVRLGISSPVRYGVPGTQKMDSPKASAEEVKL